MPNAKRPGAARIPRADGTATRQRILEVAGERFAAAGFADTTSKEIAGLADVDLASINYHFTSRAGLYQAVLAEAHRRFVDMDDVERIAASPLPPREKLTGLIRFLVGGAFRQELWPMTVLAREVLAPTVHMHRLQDQEVLPKLKLVLPILSEITAIPATDPVLVRCLPSIAAPCAAIALVGQGKTPMGQLIGNGAEEQVVEQLSVFVLGGLDAIAARYLNGGW
ncbi:TetR/AcrR family transcriptional regulator [Pseudooceanicola sp. C21-150M6]|uniref:TetR/AcrR family transcriptional regulator n=1 Tax=Pseudooceanicola sp. C21-150M6 TaxID=3434355 RepID=UPI003D7FA17A